MFAVTPDVSLLSFQLSLFKSLNFIVAYNRKLWSVYNSSWILVLCMFRHSVTFVILVLIILSDSG